ncbi:uncharacterized protein [Battus philenor]|uniref:uncharacterized protein n=1 Tax=Battus philenor TaxID=42288 RepID=UPI0035CFF453
MKLPEMNETFTRDSHLRYEHVRRWCDNVVTICDGAGTPVCALRVEDGGTEYADFENSCVLFMENMCLNPGREFSIIDGGSCKQYKSTRRNSIDNKNFTENATTDETEKPVLRAPAKMSTLYDVDSAFDYHLCPLSCPDTYAPVCLSVNRGFGKYFKFYTFVNHCSGDLYYCKHWQEFSAPPNEEENVVSSNLGWSFCGSSRYLQFARFSEVASSMGHYGWLAGNYKYSHIMEPHQKMPGYG